MILGYTENVYANKYIPKDKVEGTDYYLDEYYEDIYENYRNVMEDFVWEYLKNDKKSIYVGFINETQDIHSIIKETGKYIDEELDEKKYMEILANLMATMDVGVSEIMYHQAEADTLKQTDDYILDAIDIVTETIGLDLEKLNTDIGHELEYIMDLIDINKSIIEFNINNINDLKYYNYLMEKYDLYHEFLDLIINNAETEELKRAAHTLDYFAGQALFANFTYFDEVTRNFEENIGEDVFFNKIVMKMLEEPEIVTDSIENQEALKLLGNIYKKISLGELVFKIGIFSGDMIFGTSNMYNRYNEIYVMKEIRDILIRGIEEEDKKITGIEQYDNIEKVINYLKYMLYVNSRGEYCVYNLVVSDGQLMSLINMGNVDDYNRLIKQVQSINTSLENQIDNIVPDLFDYKKDNVIENTTDNEQNEDVCYYLSEMKYSNLYGDFSWSKREYDKNGNCIEITKFNEQGEIIGRIECKNDINGNEIERISYDKESNITSSMKREYDNKNNLIKTIYSDANGLYAWEENIYDNRGNMIVNTYFKDGEISNKVIRTYDDKNNIISECIYPSKSSYMTKYEYNEHNKIIKKTEYDFHSNIESHTDYTYEYNGNIEKCTKSVYAANGDLVQIVENIVETTFTETGMHENINSTSYNAQREIQLSYSEENKYIAIKKSKSKDLDAISFDFNPEIVGTWETLSADSTQTYLMLEFKDDLTAGYHAVYENYSGAFLTTGDNAIKIYFGNGKIYKNSITEYEEYAIDTIIDAEIDFEKNEMYCQITSDGYTWDVVLNKVE